jgi:hypothetical protein
VNPLGDKLSPSGFTELHGDLRALKLCPQAGMLRGLESLNKGMSHYMRAGRPYFMRQGVMSRLDATPKPPRSSAANRPRYA